MNILESWLLHFGTRFTRRCLVGREQRWVFKQPPQGWVPPTVRRTSLYLHVHFCRHLCPYCPYTKVPYQESLVEPYTRAAVAEVDWWANAIGRAEITSLYIGGGTPTLAVESVAQIIARVRERFSLKGKICIETNPSDVNEDTLRWLHRAGVTLVSLGVQSFQSKHLAILGRDYKPAMAEFALSLLTGGGFASVNVDLIFALPDQTVSDVTADISHAVCLGANQVTAYPLFTFPYSAVGKYLRLKAVRMPNLRIRRTHYHAIHRWCLTNGFERTSVWGFKVREAPRYSSVTRDGYIGIGPGAGTHLPDGFTLNTFDFDHWRQTFADGRSAIALRMPFTALMSAWWWFYWRLYDTHIPLDRLDEIFKEHAHHIRLLLKVLENAGLGISRGLFFELTEKGAFWLHLAQNHFALNYVNTLWTRARQDPWPKAVAI